MLETIRPIKSGTLAKQVFELLRTAIFEGELRPGDPLREARLAQQFQVSQVPVREALVQLERLGLVIRVPNKETTVTRFSDEEIQERLAIRRLLEVMAFVEAAQRMTVEHFIELERRLEALDQAAAKNAYFETAQADLEFHRYVWQRSGNRTLYTTLDQLTAPLFAFASLKRRGAQENLSESMSPHGELVEALKSRDAEVIRETLDGQLSFYAAMPIPR